jgi:bacterioferritin (cytochrome b1)
MATETDYSLHTDEELREGIRKAQEQHDRVERADSPAAAAANEEQIQLMQSELDRRGREASEPPH